MTVVVALSAVAILFALSALAVAIGREDGGHRVIYGGCLAVALFLFAAAVASLLRLVAASSVTLPLGLPWLGAQFRIDGLSAFFLAVIDLGAAGASLYAIGYGRHEHEPLRVLPFYPGFLAGMNLALMADDAFAFLLSWEFMSLSSWALVVSAHRDRANVSAGYVYLVMASAGTVALLLAFGLLAGPDGAYGFAAIRAAEQSPGLKALVLGLALFGAGSKAGLVPLHVWLPLAHPAAPSHVSALMSGVMTKVAVYGFIRIVFDLIGPPVWWASVPVLAFGAISAVLGVLYALMQGDLKRMLAYSTIENIGFVFVGLGLALAFAAHGMTSAAALAMTAALLHVFNHSLFKSLLFYGAGAVLVATGVRDMEKLGGLIHGMPKTAFVFLAGCMAISALPPLNGFVSEWLAFQAILLSPQIPQWGLKFMVPAVGAMLALSAALAAACFIKAFGITFLGRPRSQAAADAGEIDRWSLTAMFAIAVLCLAAGILPGLLIDAISPVAQALVGGRMPTQAAIPWLSIIPIAEGRSSYNGLLVFAFIALSAWMSAFAIHRLASHGVRRGPAWDCGYPEPSTATQYTAGSFSQPIRRVYGGVAFDATEKIDMPPPGDPRPARIEVTMLDPVWSTFYAPVERVVMATAEKLNRLQFLTIRSYLSLVFAALVLLLLVLALWP